MGGLAQWRHSAEGSGCSSAEYSKLESPLKIFKSKSQVLQRSPCGYAVPDPIDSSCAQWICSEIATTKEKRFAACHRLKLRRKGGIVSTALPSSSCSLAHAHALLIKKTVLLPLVRADKFRQSLEKTPAEYAAIIASQILQMLRHASPSCHLFRLHPSHPSHCRQDWSLRYQRSPGRGSCACCQLQNPS